MAMNSLSDLFVHTLRDVYFAEKLLTKKLPEMADKASSSDLKKAFESHQKETENHVTRLDQVFDAIGEKASGEECPAMEGIVEEAEEVIGEIEDTETRDAALIASAQAAEHYEITRYGTLVAWAEELGHKDALQPLRDTLAEEKEADKKLLVLGEDRVNKKAA